MKNIILMILVVVSTQSSIAQGLSGKVIDAETKEGIPYASVYIMGVQIGTITDSIGGFQFQASLPDEVTLRVSSSLYKSKLIAVRSIEKIIVELEVTHLELDEVVLIMPSGVMQRDNTVRVDRLDLKELNAIPASNLAEAVANLNGVQQASMGAGIAKPVIRGMQGIRVLTILNGLRIQNQQWGGDHGLGISQLGIGAVEVIKGPSSLLYGADAFGGVLYLVDEKFARENAYEITVKSKFESVNIGSTNSIMFKMAKKNVRFNVAGLYSDFADFQLPNGKYLENTRYVDHGLKARLGVNKKNWAMQARYMYSYSVVGIPGGHDHEEEEGEEEEDHLAELLIDVPSRNRIAPAQRIQNHFASLTNKFYFKKSNLNVLIGYTHNELSEFEDDLAVPSLQMNLSNLLYNAKWTTKFNSKWKLVVGTQGMAQNNKNVPGLEEQLIPNYSQNDNGIYAISYWTPVSRFSMQFGGRYDIRQLKSTDFNRTFVSPNYSIGSRWQPFRQDDKHIVRFNVSSGFRAPHVSELLVEGEHHGALRYEVGNPDLKAERATQFDLDYEFKAEHFSFVINPFYNYIQNYIQIEAQDSIVEDLPLYNFDQEDQVSLYGVDLGIHYHPHFAHWIHMENSFSLVQGESFNGESISLMPQPRVNNLIKFSFKKKGKFELNEIVLQHQYYFEQTKIAVFENTTASYNMVNLGLNMIWNLKNPIEIGIGAKNLLNERYVNHLSRLKNIKAYDAGRNIYINIRYVISGKLKDRIKMI